MKSFPNIEKSGFKKESYVGYGGGKVWIISKSNSSYGNWIARPQDAAHFNVPTIYAMTLKSMSDKLAALQTKNNPRKRNPSRGTADMHAARDLYLSAESYREVANQKRSIIQNLMLKKKKGVYKLDLACKLWRYWIDAAAKVYRKENGISFNVPTRNAAAEMVTEVEDAKMAGGEYGDIATYKRNPKRPIPIGGMWEGQPRNMKPSNYRYVKKVPDGYVFADGNKLELFTRRKSIPHWHLRYKGHSYEFVSDYVKGNPKKRARKKNPVLRYILCVTKKGTKRMWFNGRTFSDSGPPKEFASKDAALTNGQYLLKHFPILDRYRMTVEPKPLGK